jgi:uncharacterized repeat protein (TIGR01451 family)
MVRPRLVVLLTVALLIGATAIVSARQPVAAQSVNSVTLSITPNTTKAQIGDIVEFTVRVTNTGSEPTSGLNVSLGLPDALDFRSALCPGASNGGSCEITGLPPGSFTNAQFYVHVGSRTANGTVTSQANDSTGIVAFVEIAPIKVVGPGQTHR